MGFRFLSLHSVTWLGAPSVIHATSDCRLPRSWDQRFVMSWVSPRAWSRPCRDRAGRHLVVNSGLSAGQASAVAVRTRRRSRFERGGLQPVHRRLGICLGDLWSQASSHLCQVFRQPEPAVPGRWTVQRADPAPAARAGPPAVLGVDRLRRAGPAVCCGLWCRTPRSEHRRRSVGIGCCAAVVG